MRKTQQLRCYAAQEALGTGTIFGDVATAQRWVDALRDEPWWHLQGYSLAVLRIEVNALPASSVARGIAHYEHAKSAGSIGLRQDGLNARTVLHEVAHVLAWAQQGSQAHDPAWARTYLTLVSQVMGPDAYLKLRVSFDEQEVCYDVPPLPHASGIAL